MGMILNFSTNTFKTADYVLHVYFCFYSHLSQLPKSCAFRRVRLPPNRAAVAASNSVLVIPENMGERMVSFPRHLITEKKSNQTST